MAKPLVPDELWPIVEPFPSPVPVRPFGGRPPVPNRAALGGILFVLKTGISRRMLPADTWHQVGVWQRLHEALLTKLEDAGRIDTE